MAYRQEIIFNSNPEVGENISFSITETTGIVWYMLFVSERTASNEVTVGSSIEETLLNLKSAIEIDYDNQYIVEINGTQIYVKYFESILETYFFTTFTDFRMSFTEFEDPYNIISIEYSEADNNKCNKIKLNIVTNLPTQNVLQPIQTEIDNLTEFSIEVSRGYNGYLILSQNDGENQNTTQIVIETPDILNEDKIDVLRYYCPTCAGTDVTIINNTNIALEFSLNDIDWQSTPNFNKLLLGNHTLYVRDVYGCKITKQFYINDDIYYLEPYVKLSKANSLRFANVISYDCVNFKIDENTLSCDENVDIPYKEIMKYQNCDIITTQIKTNYSNIDFKIYDKNGGNEQLIAVDKITSNLNKKQKIDCKTIQLDDGVGIYFISGNLYDYVTNEKTGEYILNGELPDWAVVGNVFIYNNIIYPINKIDYIESINANAIITTLETHDEIILGALWNEQVYEVYEASIDFALFNGDYYVEIILSDPQYTSIKFKSELINIKNKQNGVFIECWNDENTDIYIGNNIKHKFRFETEYIKAISSSEIGTYKTDDNMYLYESINFEGDEFKFMPLTRERAKQLYYALIHQNVLIQGVSRVAAEVPELESLGGGNNLYIVKAKLIKAESGTTFTETLNTGVYEIPAILTGDIGFIKYK